MKQEITAKNQAQSTQINRVAYILYMVLVIYFVLKSDYESALTNMGVALVFDPFDASIKWQDRPLYQKAWLIIHVALVILGFACIFLIK